MQQALAQKSQCGATDEREISSDPAIGRMMQSLDGISGCTGTLISKYCMVSAGHCTNYARFVEFNTPLSHLGKIQHSLPEDIYKLDQIIDYQRAGAGNDWIVFTIKKNEVTGAIPGIKQGHYSVSFEVPAAPLDITITGYGADRRPDRNFAQQSAQGIVTKAENTTIEHQIDTQGGNSGSSIIEMGSRQVIGVHTHGGCSTYANEGGNLGTMLANHPEFKEAVKKCLALEAN